MDTNILLESGTNELEILEFCIAGNHYGINVAKVREILPMTNIIPVPNAHPCIEGIFMPRDVIITVIDLGMALHFPQVENKQENMLLVTNFNNLYIAFDVEKVIGIHRVFWSDIVKPDPTVSGTENGVATGIIKTEKQLIIILDFERIVEEICPETGLKISEIESLGERPRNDTPIVLAEDSTLLKKMLEEALHMAGYYNLTIFTNGQDAWDYLQGLKNSGRVDEGVKCVITDIEMPLMDGHRLIHLIRADDKLKKLPIVVFSSLINEEMRIKGEALGANSQITKPEIGKLVEIIDSLVK